MSAMNRHQRRATRALQQIALSKFDSRFDVQVDGKYGLVVMIFANQAGRKIVNVIWPDVVWSTDDHFASCHSADWLFTHIRVTKLPATLETNVPLSFASNDAIACAVAMQIRKFTGRVCHHSGQGQDIHCNVFEGAIFTPGPVDLYAEYVPPGRVTLDGKGEAVH